MKTGSSELKLIPVKDLGERYQKYRLSSLAQERALRQSLERYGQLTPVVVCRVADGYEVVDGFKRRAVALELGLERLQVRCVEVTEREAKAAVYSLNQLGGRTSALEEGWIVQALVSEDGMSQVEAGELLGRHKSWVCRRLALVERLGPEAKEDLRLGLLSGSHARELARLPAGNQAEVVELVQRQALTRDELTGVVDLILGCTTPRQRDFVMERPREALEQARGSRVQPHDPRLSPSANRIAKQIGQLIEHLSRMAGWLGGSGYNELTPRDEELLRPSLELLAKEASFVGERAADRTAPAQALR